MRYGHLQPSEYENLTRPEAVVLAKHINRLRNVEVELYVTMTKIVAQAHVGGAGRAAEVRA